MMHRSLADLLDLDPLIPLAWRAATSAGRFLRDERPATLAIDTKTTPTDVVSDMDRSAEALIVEQILKARPRDGLLGEEGAERPSSTGIRWIIDPLDGTVNYLLGLPEWAVSIGVEEDGKTRLGVIDIPMHDETFIAIAGQGAWRVHRGGADRLAIRHVSELSQALISTGFGYDAAIRRQQTAVLESLIGEIRDIRCSGAATLDFCSLARGWTDGYFLRDLKPWDLSAGALIAEEAGALVTGIGGEPWTAMVVAGSPSIVDSLLRLLPRTT
jgi:myo-inositol-1(or 4)-monophosphatase